MVPPQGRNDILQELHEAHPGVVRMKLLVRSYVWWPSIDQDIEDKVEHCQQCQLNQKAPEAVTMHPWGTQRGHGLRCMWTMLVLFWVKCS